MIAPLRVLLYAPHFAEYALRLAEGLAGSARVLLVCERRNLAAECPPSLIARVSGDVQLATFDGSAGFPAGPWTRQVRLRWLIYEFRPTIAHVQEQADGPTAAMLTRLAQHVPVVLTVHDPGPHSGNDAKYAEEGGAFRERLRAGAAAYHVHGAFCERELRASRRIEASVLGTALGPLLEPRPEQRRQPEPRTLLFFGRMEAYKGLETLLDAADILRARDCAFRLIVAGDGPELQRLGPRLQAHHIELHDGFIGHDDAIALFQRACVVVAPYRDATQSGIVASAFGNGRPVVASSIGGLTDSVTHGRDGLLVPPHDASALAEQLACLLSDDDKLAALTAGVASTSRNELRWDTIAARLDAFYREILAARGAPAGMSAVQPVEARS